MKIAYPLIIILIASCAQSTFEKKEFGKVVSLKRVFLTDSFPVAKNGQLFYKQVPASYKNEEIKGMDLFGYYIVKYNLPGNKDWYEVLISKPNFHIGETRLVAMP
jgi:hypothetical protein